MLVNRRIRKRNLLTFNEMCEALQIKSTTAYKLMNFNEIPFVRIGGKRLFPVDELERHFGCKLFRDVDSQV